MFEIDNPKFIAMVEKGVPIERLEKRLRPSLGVDNEAKEHDGWYDYSSQGFLGQDESLLKVIHDDGTFIEKEGATHDEIADALEEILRQTKSHPRRSEGYFEIDLPGGRYIVIWAVPFGDNSCPWFCRNYVVPELIGADAVLFVPEQFTIGKGVYALTAGEHTITADERNNCRTGVEHSGPITILHPHLVREHHFFEGRKSPYRVDPGFIINAFGLARHP